MNKTNYKELVEKYGTPLYIFDSSEAKERINGIKEILPKYKNKDAVSNDNFFISYFSARKTKPTIT